MQKKLIIGGFYEQEETEDATDSRDIAISF